MKSSETGIIIIDKESTENEGNQPSLKSIVHVSESKLTHLPISAREEQRAIAQNPGKRVIVLGKTPPK